jgi:2-oxoglutarate dehydrogenase complex dehydrogenase (E1) component-like enzyme
MYEIIKSKIGVVDEYGEKLHNEGIFARSEADNYRNEYISHLNSELELVDTGKSEPWYLFLFKALFLFA